MSRKKAPRAPRLTIAQRLDIAHAEGNAAGLAAAEKFAAEKAARAKAAAPRRSFWIEQNESGLTLTESTAGSVRGKAWTGPNAETLGVVIDDLISNG